MTTTPKRRWPRFTLRTLFVAVTLAACGLAWLGQQAQLVRHRRLMLKHLISRSVSVQGPSLMFFKTRTDALEDIRWKNYREPEAARNLPAIRHLIGDVEVDSIWLAEIRNEDIEALSAFPEARVRTSK